MKQFRWHVRLDPDPCMMDHAKWEVRILTDSGHGHRTATWIYSFPNMWAAHDFIDRVREGFTNGFAAGAVL